MRSVIFCLITLFVPLTLHAQDTIYMKSGVKIPAVIIGINKEEIKYKKFTQPESNGIYSVFSSDVLKIRYKDGKVNDLSGEQKSSIENSLSNEPPSTSMKFTVGLSENYFRWKDQDDLLLFWRTKNNNNTLNLEGNRKFPSLNLAMYGPLDGHKRNWLGTSLVLALTAPDAIYAFNDNSLPNEIQLRAFFYNIGLFYGHTVNHRKTMVVLFEPGIDLAFMSGHITLNGTEYKEFSTGLSSHFALGFDWSVSKRLMLTARLGTGTMKIKESHEDATNSTLYRTFYVNPPDNKDPVIVKWGGYYVNAGLSYCFYGKIKTGRPE